MSEDKEKIIATNEPNKIGAFLTQGLITAGLMLLAFLVGFGLMGLMWWGAASDRNTAQKQLRLSQLQNDIASAAIDARRGDYEPARQATSKFFSGVTAEMENTGSNIFTKEQQTQLRTLLVPRDEIITLLSRNDPAVTEKLAEMYVLYRKAINSSLETAEPSKPVPPATNSSPASAATPAPSN